MVKPPPGFVLHAADVGYDLPYISAFHGTVWMYALPDGTPASMVEHLTFDIGSSPGTVFVVVTFTNWDDPVTISDPQDVWRSFTSPASEYAVAYPSGWHADPSGSEQRFLSPSERTIVSISVDKVAAGTTLNDVVNTALAQASTERGQQPQSVDQTTLAGWPGAAITFAATTKHPLLMEAVTVRGTTEWRVSWTSEDPTSSDTEDFTTLLASFQLFQ